jgi:hypothetical protein
MNRFTAHTVNELECQYLEWGVSMLLTDFFFYASVFYTKEHCIAKLSCP